MAIKIPSRNYLTFQELQSRWECTDTDLRYAILSGALKPSVKIDRELSVPHWQEGIRDELEPSGFLTDENDQPIKTRPRGWQYLQEPAQTAPFDCSFSLISDARDPDKPSEPDDFPSATWLLLPEPVTLDRVATDAVFLLKEIVRYEEEHGENAVQPGQTKSLGTRERETLLKLVIGMAMGGYGFNLTDRKNTAPKEIADDLAELGISITDDTVRKYLKQAVETVLPAKRRQD